MLKQAKRVLKILFWFSRALGIECRRLWGLSRANVLKDQVVRGF